MAVLLLRLSAPMQSWGTELKLKDHPTDPYPSKSGVIGMIASAEGRKRDADIGDLVKLKFGARVDRSGTICFDYQTAWVRKGTFDTSPMKSYIGNRGFLCDAVFTIALEGESDRLSEIEFNLNHPANALYCGRRGFPVNPDFVIGVFEEDIRTALFRHGYTEEMRIFLEVDSGGDRLVKDNPVSFDFHKRQWNYRMIKEF